MEEITVNLHMHTRFSDGSGLYRDLIEAARQTGVDALIITDHNVLVQGIAGYYGKPKNRVLVIAGEEVHDRTRQPQKNHLLAFGHRREVSPFAESPQRLIDAVHAAGGLAFLAHPVDPAAPAVGEEDISWVDWDIHNYDGIELWNGFSEFKAHLKTYAHALWYVFQPKRIPHGPLPQTLALWDRLLSPRHPVVAVGGSDAHALQRALGPIKKTIFPYAWHFQAVNTHVLLEKPRTGEAPHDEKLILDALRRGRAFIGYDLPASTRGFRFRAHDRERQALMGDSLRLENSLTLQIHLPDAQGVLCRLLRNGQIIKTWHNRQACIHVTGQPGVYRVEVYRRYLGGWRGWIFSNPIYLQAG